MSADYTINDLYQGGYSTLEPNYGNVFVGYRVGAKSLGITTDPRNADVMTEIRQKMAPGTKHVELSLVSPEVFDSIPQQHLKEVKRQAKLAGVEVSVHAPVVEPSGITERGGFAETNREVVERQMTMAVERSHELDDKGNIPVTFHSSAILPAPAIKKTKEGEEIQSMMVINQETGQIRQVEKEERYYPGMDLEKPKVFGAEKEVDALNHSEWTQTIDNLLFNKERADEIIGESYPVVQKILPKILSGEYKREDLTMPQKQALSRYQTAHGYLNNIQVSLQNIFDKAYKYPNEQMKEKERTALKEMSKEFAETLEKGGGDVRDYSEAMHNLMIGLQTQVHPEVYKPLHKFAEDKTTKTFANVAFNSYKKFGDKAPLVCIENPPAGAAFARGEELKNLVEESRKKFVDIAVKEKNMSRGEAQRVAEKLIGVTWDVGHINMLRKHGFEEKDIIKETEKVAPLVKHVHLSDNFGFEHTELPMGMGNVPIKEMMGKLGKKGFEAKKIVEAASWWQHFKTSPMKTSYQAFGSPLYSMKMQPYWNQTIGLQQDYFGGYGMMLPQTHYETFGAGFSQLPMELGGQKQGAQGSRMSGRGME